MGTSQSNPGPPSGVGYLPDGSEGDSEHLAPPGRFRQARRLIGAFAGSGSGTDLKRGIAYYYRDGLGGARRASKRLSGTVSVVHSLYRTFAVLAGVEIDESDKFLELLQLQDRPIEEILNSIVEAICPVDGKQDTEAHRHAVNEALSDLLSRYPDASMFDLTFEQRIFVVERYIVQEIFERLDLDIGSHLRRKCKSVKVELQRFGEIKNYIGEVVARTFQNTLDTTKEINLSRIREFISSILQNAIEVFESYV